jgi:hypothetical protein
MDLRKEKCFRRKILSVIENKVILKKASRRTSDARPKNDDRCRPAPSSPRDHGGQLTVLGDFPDVFGEHRKTLFSFPVDLGGKRAVRL